MLSWLAKKMIARNMERASAGDLGPTLKMYAEDVRFSFPGDSSWKADLHSKDELEAWLRRFADVGLQIRPDEVVLKGFPWSQTLCVRGTVHLDSPGGERVYDNRYVLWGHLSWGLVRNYEVYEDTQKSKALDRYLSSTGEALAARSTPG